MFAEKGFHDAQMTEIAAAAELSLSSLYSMFSGKQAIYEEVMREAAERMCEEVRGRVERTPGAGDRIDAVVEGLFLYFERNRSLVRILLSGTRALPWSVQQRMGPTSKELLDEFYGWVMGLCAELIDERRLASITPDALCAALLGSVTYQVAFLLEERPGEPLTEAAPTVQAIFASLTPDSGKRESFGP